MAKKVSVLLDDAVASLTDKIESETIERANLIAVIEGAQVDLAIVEAELIEAADTLDSINGLKKVK